MSKKIKESEMWKVAKEALVNFDYEGLARAYQESQISWNAQNWKDFNELIKKEERGRVVEEIGKIANTRWEKNKMVTFPKGKRKWCIACAINLCKHLETNETNKGT